MLASLIARYGWKTILGTLLLAAGLGLVGVLARLVRPRAAKLSAPVPPVA